jgi:hypothetical protein
MFCTGFAPVDSDGLEEGLGAAEPVNEIDSVLVPWPVPHADKSKTIINAGYINIFSRVLFIKHNTFPDWKILIPLS